MSALTRLLYPLPAVRRSPAMLFAWWESRRPTYNLVVGGSGLITLGVVELLAALPPHSQLWVPWPAVVVYGVAANVCYSFGFVIEAFLERVWGDDVAPVGPVLFRQGLIFSVGLTLFPMGVAWLAYLVEVARSVFKW